MPLDSHTRLGPYEILALIGEGGMGQVYRARDTRLGRDVAIKVVATEFTARFQTEARAIAALNHPNICALHDVGPNYLVMEFVEGETLAARLKTGPLKPEEATRLAVAIAEALAEAHAKNVVHRDLKPGNVMITTEGRPKLLDFGLAKMLDHSDPDATRTVEGAVMGTLAYMSPEQLQGQRAGASSDIFTFGTVLYEMLSGRRAFHTAGLREEPPVLAGVSTGLSAIVSRCLRRSPEERYASMAEVKNALERMGTAAVMEPAASIAVLPFANMSGDKDNEYFSDGLAEEILNSLVRVDGLKVTARTSAFSFRGKDLDVRAIGEKLGVKSVLEGSVRRSGNRIRVTAQLINIADGYHLWSERYDRDMTDVFAVQDEISAAIVSALKLKLAPAKPKASAVNLDAYHQVLWARYFRARQTPDDLQRALECAEKALAIDPNYALAHVIRAGLLMTMGTLGGKSPVEMKPLVRAAAMKALELDDSQTTAHAVLALVAASEYDWNEALRQYRLTRESPAEGPIFGLLLSSVVLPLGRVQEARRLVEDAIARDPLDPFYRVGLANVLLVLGDDEGAERELKHLLEIQETFLGYMLLGVLYTQQGRRDDAIAVFEKGVKSTPWFPPLWYMLAANYRLAGHRVKAEATLTLPRLASLTGHPLMDMARGSYHAMLSEFDRAADFLERAVEGRHYAVLSIAFAPAFEKFRQTPRGQALLAKMNLPWNDSTSVAT